MNSALCNFYLCFLSIIIFVVSCVIWDNKNGIKLKFTFFQSYYFTCFKQKFLQNRLILTLSVVDPVEKSSVLNALFIIIITAIISIIFIIIIIIAIIITIIIIIIINIIIVIIFIIIILTFLFCLYWEQGTIKIK